MYLINSVINDFELLKTTYFSLLSDKNRILFLCPFVLIQKNEKIKALNFYFVRKSLLYNYLKLVANNFNSFLKLKFFKNVLAEILKNYQFQFRSENHQIQGRLLPPKRTLIVTKYLLFRMNSLFLTLKYIWNRFSPYNFLLLSIFNLT